MNSWSSMTKPNKFYKGLVNSIPALKDASLEQIPKVLFSLLKNTSNDLTKTQINEVKTFISVVKSKKTKDDALITLYDYALQSEGMFTGKTAERKSWFKGTAIGGMECSNPNR